MAFHEAEPAGFGHRVVGRGSTNDAPGDGVRNHSVVEVPDVSAHPFPVGPVLGVVVPDIGHVTVPSCHKGAASQAGVMFGGSCVLPGDLGSINYRFYPPILVSVTR